MYSKTITSTVEGRGEAAPPRAPRSARGGRRRLAASGRARTAGRTGGSRGRNPPHLPQTATRKAAQRNHV